MLSVQNRRYRCCTHTYGYIFVTLLTKIHLISTSGRCSTTPTCTRISVSLRKVVLDASVQLAILRLRSRMRLPRRESETTIAGVNLLIHVPKIFTAVLPLVPPLLALLCIERAHLPKTPRQTMPILRRTRNALAPVERQVAVLGICLLICYRSLLKHVCLSGRWRYHI